VITNFRRNPACRRAEELLRKIVAGEADGAEKEEFGAHLSTCHACASSMGKALALTHALENTLQRVAEHFPHAPALLLPPRAPLRMTRILTDFTMFVVVGLGLLLLIALAAFGYRSVTHAFRQAQIFRAVNEVLQITRRGPDATAAPRADPWGHPYRLTRPPAAFAARSDGPNGRDDGGGEDDITERTKAPALARFRRPAGDHPR
jgi:hypothetical protein